MHHHSRASVARRVQPAAYGGPVVDALAKEFGGFVEHRCDARGITVAPSVQEHDPNVTTQFGTSRRGTESSVFSTSKRDQLSSN